MSTYTARLSWNGQNWQTPACRTMEEARRSLRELMAPHMEKHSREILAAPVEVLGPSGYWEVWRQTAPTDSQLAAMRAVLKDHEQRTGERPTTATGVWLALAVHARMHSPEWRDWMTLEHHRAPWLRGLMEDREP